MSLDLQEAVEGGTTLEQIAAARHLPVRNTGAIPRGTGDIPNGPRHEMLSEAFDAPAGSLTRVFDTPLGVYVLRPQAEQPSRLPPFDEARAKVEQLAVGERALEAARARAAQLHEAVLAKRREGLTFEELYLVLGVTPERPAPFTRTDAIGSLGRMAAVADTLFALKPGDVSGVLEGESNLLIAVIRDRLPFDEAQLAKDHDAFHSRLLDDKHNARVSEWLASLREQARLHSFVEAPANKQ